MLNLNYECINNCLHKQLLRSSLIIDRHLSSYKLGETGHVFKILLCRFKRFYKH